MDKHTEAMGVRQCEVCRNICARLRCDMCGQDLCFSCTVPHETNPILRQHPITVIDVWTRGLSGLENRFATQCNTTPYINLLGSASSSSPIHMPPVVPYHGQPPPGPMPLPGQMPPPGTMLPLGPLPPSAPPAFSGPHLSGSMPPGVYPLGSVPPPDAPPSYQSYEQYSSSPAQGGATIVEASLLMSLCVEVQRGTKWIFDLEVLDTGDIVAVRDENVQLLDSNFTLKKYVNFPNVAKPYKNYACRGVTILPDKTIALTSKAEKQIDIYDGKSVTYNRSINSHFLDLRGICTTKGGELAVVDNTSWKIIDCVTSQVFVTTENIAKTPRGFTINSRDTFIIVENVEKCVKGLTRHGALEFVYNAEQEGNLSFPRGVCVDKMDRIILADHYNDRVLLLSPTGKFIKALLTKKQHGLTWPTAVAVCPNTGYLYVGTEYGMLFKAKYTN